MADLIFLFPWYLVRMVDVIEFLKAGMIKEMIRKYKQEIRNDIEKFKRGLTV